MPRRSTVRMELDPATLAAFGTFDYADAFRTDLVDGTVASQWARQCLTSVPPPLQGVFAAVMWHGVLGFDLAPPDTAGTLAGWEIVTDLRERFVLVVDGRLMAGCMLFEVSDSHATWTTTVRFRGRWARPVWAACSPLHRLMAATLMSSAARSLDRQASLKVG